MASAARLAWATRSEFTRWIGRLQRQTSTARPALVGAALESAVMGLARRNPEYVVVGAA